MKIVLINPSLGEDMLYGNWNLTRVDTVCPPFGLLYIASALRQEGHEVNLVDARAQRLSHQAVMVELDSISPDVVGISATTISIFSASELASLIKERDSRIKIILGGVHITAVPEETMHKFPHVDIGVIGEGEMTVIDIINTLEDRRKLEEVKGIIFREGKKLIRTAMVEYMGNLDSLPFPAWDLLPSLKDNYRMSIVGTRSKNSTALVTTRGCPGRCTFCDTSVFGHKLRAFSADYVVGMIEYLVKHYGIEDFLFYDDNFVTFRDRLKRICELLKEKEIKITWSCETRIGSVTPEILLLMKEHGCWQIEYGIESGSQKILDFMKKGITIKQIEDTIRWTKEAGIETRGNFIFGNLMETRETLEESIEFALRLDLDYFQQTFLTPYPGSEIYRIASLYGKFDPDWRKMSNTYINFIPNGLSEQELIEFSKSAFRRFYLRPRIIWRHLKKISDWDMLKRQGEALKTWWITTTR